jgi:hypothetical protein
LERRSDGREGRIKEDGGYYVGDFCEWGDVKCFERLVFNESDLQMESWSWI